MKKYILLSFIVFFSLSVLAKDSILVANDLYKKGQYEKAIDIYLKMLPEGNESPEIYYNIGNAYYKNEQISKAILYYERALLIQPNFDNARFNLEMAQSKTIDKINKQDSFFLKRWFDSIANIKSSNSWAAMSIVLFILCLGLLFLYAFSKILLLRKVSFYTAAFLLILSLSGMLMSKRQKDKVEKREYAIIMSSSVTVKNSPDDSGTTTFVLHEGTKVKISKILDIWVEIILEDGNVGWMLSEDLEII